MDNQAWFILISVFVAVCAIALCIQAGMLFALYKTAKATEEQVTRVVPQVQALIPKVEAMIPKVEAVVPKVEALIASTTETIDVSRKHIGDIGAKTTEIMAKTSEILDMTKVQIKRIDGVIEDASARAHNQLAHAEMVLDDTMSRAQQTVTTVHSGVMKPLREIHGVAAGVRTTFLHLMRGGRPSPAQATADEEMFI